MCVSLNYGHKDKDFFGDNSPQPPFGFRDSVKSLFTWSKGAANLAAWSALTVALSKVVDLREVDWIIKCMCKMIPVSCGIKVKVEGAEKVDPAKAYVFVSNHVNIFDMFVIYSAIPQYARSLEHIDHFSWPLIGPFITAAGQIPVDPLNSRFTAKSLKTSADFLKKGNSLVVLPEGSRTLDGTVGTFHQGAFRLAIKAGVPVVPMAIYGGRMVSRRGDWRMRKGEIKVVFADPVSSLQYTLSEAVKMANHCQKAVVSILQKENQKCKSSTRLKQIHSILP